MTSALFSVLVCVVVLRETGVGGVPLDGRQCPVASTDCSEYGAAFDTLTKQFLNGTMVGLTAIFGGADARTAMLPVCGMSKMLEICGEDYYATCDPQLRYGLSSTPPKYIATFRQSSASARQSCMDLGITDTDMQSADSPAAFSSVPDTRRRRPPCSVASYSCLKFGRAMQHMGLDLANRTLITMSAMLSGAEQDTDSIMTGLCRSGYEMESCVNEYLVQCNTGSAAGSPRMMEATRNFQDAVAKMETACAPYSRRF